MGSASSPESSESGAGAGSYVGAASSESSESGAGVGSYVGAASSESSESGAGVGSGSEEVVVDGVGAVGVESPSVE